MAAGDSRKARADAAPKRAMRPETVEALVALTTILGAAALLFVGLASFGIWDPWEIDLAERIQAGGDAALPPLGDALLRLSFAELGMREWSGRLPMAIAGLLTVLFTFALARRHGGVRLGSYAALVCATSPLLVFNARTMIGHAVPMAAQAGLALGLYSAVFPSRWADDDPKRSTRSVTACLLVAGGFVTASVASAGLLVGALPPLVAVGVLACLDGRLARRPRDARDLAAWSIAAAGLLAALGTALAVYWDRAGYSPITGSAPIGRAPGSFEAMIETVLHGFAPWSALLLVALGQALSPRVEVDGPSAASTLEGARHRLALFAVLWAAAGYVAAVLYGARYGTPFYLPVAPLAVLVACFLVSVEESEEAWWTAGVIAALFAGLLFRDFALYPDRPLAALGTADLTIPGDLGSKVPWAAVLGAFAATALVALGVEPKPRPLGLAEPYRFLRAQWRLGAGFRAWLVATAILLVGMLAYGIVCLVRGEALPIGSQYVRFGRAIAFVPPAIPVLVLLAQLGLYVVRRLGPFRLVPMLVAGVAVGAYAGHGFLPAVGEQYSSREVYDTFNALRGEHDDLMVYGMQARSGAYYADGELLTAHSVEAVATHLAAPERRWAAFSRTHLGQVDARFRALAERHLFVVSADNPRTVLVTNQPLRGRTNHNPLAAAVRSAPPADMQHRTDLRFGDKVELIGYDLDLPSPGYVGPGQRMAITWYWKSLARVPGSYQVFVHIDGPGGRINGDHQAADGTYPIAMWQPGDVIVDRQELSVPAHFSGGEYTLYVGLWSGPTRLPVTLGEEDGEDRAIAGRLQIR
jgi:hypothetical protein